ncbi:hypothetical protein TrRE_jg10975, partial [Triparma retinervis]
VLYAWGTTTLKSY